MVDRIRDGWFWIGTHPSEVFVGLVILFALSTTLVGLWLVVLDPLFGQLRLAWRSWRQRRADRRVVRERVERIRLEQAAQNGDPTIPRPWPPRRPGEHSQPWRETSNGDAA